MAILKESDIYLKTNLVREAYTSVVYLTVGARTVKMLVTVITCSKTRCFCVRCLIIYSHLTHILLSRWFTEQHTLAQRSPSPCSGWRFLEKQDKFFGHYWSLLLISSLLFSQVMFEVMLYESRAVPVHVYPPRGLSRRGDVDAFLSFLCFNVSFTQLRYYCFPDSARVFHKLDIIWTISHRYSWRLHMWLVGCESSTGVATAMKGLSGCFLQFATRGLFCGQLGAS